MNAAKSSWNDIEDKFTIENKNSQLTDKFRFFVSAGDLGWLFNCDLDDVVCMSASDCYVTAVNCFDASLQLKMNGLSIIGFLSKEQLIHNTKCLYNEVVLTGDASPSGVFVIVDDAVEPLVANELIAVSIASDVPLTL